jgi:glycosyltransferase 2 family protein
MKRISVKRLLLWTLRLCITVSILYYLFIKIPFSEVVASITSARVSYVLIGFLIWIFIRYIAACRMKLLTDKQGMTLSVLQILGISFSTIFYGLFLPGGYLTGGLVRWHKLSKPDNKSAEAVAAIIFDNIVDIITLCTLGILFWVLDKPSDRSYIGLSLGTILGGLFVVYILIFTRTVSPSIGNLNLNNLPFIPNILHDKANKLIISLRQYRNLSQGHLGVILVLSLACNLFSIFAHYLFALSLNVNITFITMAWVRSSLFILSMLPISISGLGVREGALVFLLKPYGVSAADAVALSFLLRSLGLCIAGIGGLLEAGKLFPPNRNKLETKEVNRSFEGG